MKCQYCFKRIRATNWVEHSGTCARKAAYKRRLAAKAATAAEDTAPATGTPLVVAGEVLPPVDEASYVDGAIDLPVEIPFKHLIDNMGDFDVSMLRSVAETHEIKLPARAKKEKLIEIINDALVEKAKVE